MLPEEQRLGAAHRAGLEINLLLVPKRQRAARERPLDRDRRPLDAYLVGFRSDGLGAEPLLEGVDAERLLEWWEGSQSARCADLLNLVKRGLVDPAHQQQPALEAQGLDLVEDVDRVMLAQGQVEHEQRWLGILSSVLKLLQALRHFGERQRHIPKRRQHARD